MKQAGRGLVITLVVAAGLSACAGGVRGTGDLGVVVERASGSLVVVDTSRRTRVDSIQGLGDLSHASVVFSRDQRFGYVFGRDGGLTKIDLLTGRTVRRVVQAGNSIGGAISQDGSLVAVSNYRPGGVKVFDAQNLDLIAEIAATPLDAGERSKVVGLVDAPGQRFVFSLFDSGEIWVADFSDRERPAVRRFSNVGKQPYDGLITPDGRYYIAGLFGEDGLALLDLWDLDAGVRRILDGYGRARRKLPVYKMPHLEGWAVAGEYAFLPAVGQHEVVVVNRDSWREVARIPVHGQPVFVMARPDERQVWVNFAHPRNGTVQVIDVKDLRIVKSLEPGRAVMHMEFTPRGEQVWISARDDNRVVVYDTRSFDPLDVVPAQKPSGIFFSSRAHRIGL